MKNGYNSLIVCSNKGKMLKNMLTKTKLKQQIEKFPEEFSINELVEKLILIEKTENEIDQLKDKKGFSKPNESLDSVQTQILSFSGAFADMDQKDYNAFKAETQKVRSSLFDRDDN